MKTNKIRAIIAASAIALTSMVVYSCWEVKSISIPAEVKANSEIKITMTTQITGKESDIYMKLVAMYCIPADWELVNVTYSTSGYSPWIAQKGVTTDEIIDGEMIPLDDSILEYTTGKPFPEAFESIYGKGGNYGNVKWVGFIAKDEHYLHDLASAAIPNFELSATATFKTSGTNYKFFFNSWLGESRDGTGSKYYGTREAAEASDDEMCTRVQVNTIEVTGGTGKMNYTLPDMVSTVPTEYRYGDFFCINLQTNLEGAESPLDDKTKVYLCGKAILADGKEVVVDEVKPENLMMKKGTSTYSKYILPCIFFDLPHSTKIAKVIVWFKDDTGTIVERCASEEGWELIQAENN